MAETREAGNFRLVLVTTSSEEEATGIAKSLVEEGLAACANIIPRIRSIYRWNGKVQDDPECLVLLKTVLSKVDDLSARVAEQHSYDVSEVISVALDRGRESYLDWLSGCIQPARRE
ncbi:MAG: divalent-cation tolerance protein CutA [Nitrospinota bacterium]|nr:divalent-cation tolerance protein CutA [Nitrospinota bacterium]